MTALLNSWFLPDKRAVVFAFKGVVAMALSLYVAMFLNLDRPYWALISAVFLQIRPEGGLVVEKGLCQILGTVIGGIVGMIILTWFSAYPELALGTLAVWFGLTSGLSAMMRRTNFIYAYAMAGITAALVVLLVMVTPATASSQTIFSVAQARISEIIIGACCAMLVSKLIYPVKVKDGVKMHARNVINQTLNYLELELDLSGSHDTRHKNIDTILELVSALNDDSSAVVYEGPEGPGQSRAASLLCNKTLSLLAMIQIFGRLQRKHPELISETLAVILEDMQTTFQRMSRSTDYHESYRMAQALRRRQIYYVNNTSHKTALETRLLKISLELTGELIMVLKAYNSLSSREDIILKAPSLKPHRDPLVGITTGVRSAAVFVVAACLWVGTGSSAVLMMMILPVVFSIVLARLPMAILTIVLRRILVGVAIAIPLSILVVTPLLARSSGDYEILILILAGPYFFGLLALANRPTLPYGIGILIPFTILVHPSPSMTWSFSVNYTLSYGMSIFVGVTVLYWMFKLITGPSLQVMLKRLMRVTYIDLGNLEYHHSVDDWFNSRMGDRLLRIATYDRGLNKERDMTDLALTALNLGHVSIRLHRLVKNIADNDLDNELRRWQKALADAFLACSKGKSDALFKGQCQWLVTKLESYETPNDQLDLIRGMFERISFTFDRSAASIRNNMLTERSS